MVIYLLNLLMLSRIGYTFDDDRLDFKELPYYLIVQVIGIATLTISRAWFGLLITVVISNALIIFWERKTKNPKIVRMASLLGFLIIYTSFVRLSGQITFSPVLISWAKSVNDSFLIIENLDELSRTNTYIFGLLFILNESNTIIRQLFDWIKISPDPPESSASDVDVIPPVDKYIKIDEYKSGRVIGILERVFAYFAVVLNEYSIIGFILAAKAFARFKELEKKAYAEYVLIGTLASILIAFISASFIISLIK